MFFGDNVKHGLNRCSAVFNACSKIMADQKVVDVVHHETAHEEGDHSAPGTFVIVLVLLGTFALYYFANWKALADVWQVR